MAVSRSTFFIVAIFCLMAGTFVTSVYGSFLDRGTVYIGVLAKLGKESCFQQWNPTAAYLKKEIPEYNVQIVCLNFDEIDKAVADKRVDFTITNPSVYVNLEKRHGASRIATLKNKGVNKSYTKFGGVIFYRADRSDIKSADDLKGKRFMAVDETSFGGWQVSYRYLLDRGIDPYRDFQSLQFSGRHDSVVMAVLNGTVDAGCVRSDTLERMAQDNTINISTLAVLDPQKKNAEFDFFLTTRLYPEWPLAKQRHTSQKLAKRVTIAMLQMPEDGAAARHARATGWTIPLDYNDIHETLRLLKLAPYEAYGTLTPGQFYQQYKQYIYSGAVFTICAFCGGAIVLALNSRLNCAVKDLHSEHQKKELLLADLNEFKLTLEQTLDCVFMFSPDSLQFIYCNHGAQVHLGYNEGELLALTPLDIKPNFTETQFRALIEPLKQTPEKSQIFTTNHRKKDGTLIPVEIHLRYVTPPQKQGRFVAIVRDITLRLQEEKERKQLQTRLLQEQKLASVGQLAAGIAHEINTPIQYLGANIDFFKEAFEDISELVGQYDELLEAAKKRDISEPLVTAVDNIAQQAEWPYLQEEIPQAINQSIDGIQQVSAIILAMKNFSRPGSLAKEMTDLNELLKTTLTVSRSEWKFYVNPVLDLDPQLPQVPCMQNEIGQVFLNIVVNATHAIAEKLGENPKGDKGTLTISSRMQKHIVRFTFTDSGCGISNRNLKKIFDPFFSTKEVGKGAGQGLAIAYDTITNKHCGTLEVVSEERVGTTFTVALPIDPFQSNITEENHNV